MSSVILPATRSRASHQLDGTIIVGGGIAGLATAAALRNIAGVQNLCILEKLDKESFHNDRSGAGAQLGPNGLRALRAIGGDELLDSVMSKGSKLTGNVMLLPQMPEPMIIPDTAEADTGLPQILIRWGVLRSTLSELVPDEFISYGVGETIAGYTTSDDDSVHLVSKSGDEIGPKSSSASGAPLIIGADGIYSTFRQCLATDSSKIPNVEEGRKEGIKYNKRVNIKAVVESPLDDTKYQPNKTYAFFTPEGGTACFAGPAGEGYSYWAISVVDDSDTTSDDSEKTETEESAHDGIARLALCPKQDKAAIKSALLSRLNNLQQPLCEFAVDIINETDPKYIYVQLSEEAKQIGPNLVSSDGKVVCVGDSAHSMSASYGQSMNFALEDAVTLALCVRDAPDQEEDGGLASALKAYERSRLGRCDEMKQRSAERAAKAMKGEQTDDVSKWIFQWKPPM